MQDLRESSARLLASRPTSAADATAQTRLARWHRLQMSGGRRDARKSAASLNSQMLGGGRLMSGECLGEAGSLGERASVGEWCGVAESPRAPGLLCPSFLLCARSRLRCCRSCRQKACRECRECRAAEDTRHKKQDAQIIGTQGLKNLKLSVLKH